MLRLQSLEFSYSLSRALTTPKITTKQPLATMPIPINSTQRSPHAPINANAKYTKFQKFPIPNGLLDGPTTKNIIRNKIAFRNSQRKSKTTRIFAGKNQVCFTFFFSSLSFAIFYSTAAAAATAAACCLASLPSSFSFGIRSFRRNTTHRRAATTPTRLASTLKVTGSGAHTYT